MENHCIQQAVWRNWEGKVITRISERPLTVSDNPNCVQSIPNYAKPPGRCVQRGQRTADNEAGN